MLLLHNFNAESGKKKKSKTEKLFGLSISFQTLLLRKWMGLYGGGMIGCAGGWINASMSSPKYCHLCDYTGLAFITISETLLPGGRGGYVGSKVTTYSSKFVGVCLDEPFFAGVYYSVILLVSTSG